MKAVVRPGEAQREPRSNPQEFLARQTPYIEVDTTLDANDQEDEEEISPGKRAALDFARNFEIGQNQVTRDRLLVLSR